MFSKHRTSWIIVVVLISIAQFILLDSGFEAHGPTQQTQPFFNTDGESDTYLEPIENWVRGNGYSSVYVSEFGEVQELRPSTRRMPGYLPIYGLSLSILPKPISKNVIIVFQWLMHLLSIFALSNIVFILTQSRLAEYATMLLYALSTFVSVYVHLALGESLSVSFAVLGGFFLIRGLKQSNGPWLTFFAGVFMTWSIFMRPAMVLFLLVALVGCLLYLIRNPRLAFTQVLLLSVAPLLLIGSWTARNYQLKNAWIVFEDSIYESMPMVYPPQTKILRDVINHHGGNYKHFYPNTMGMWFRDSTVQFDPFNGLDMDAKTLASFRQLRKLYLVSRNSELERHERELAKAKFIDLSHELLDLKADNDPIFYHITSRLKSLGRLVLIKTENRLPFPARDQLSSIQFLIKGGYVVLYNLLFVLSIIYFVRLLTRRAWRKAIWLFSFPFGYILILGAVLYNIEYRYLVPVYPFWVISSILLFKDLSIHFMVRKHD